MKNFKHSGETLTFVAAGTLTSGKAVVITDRVGIATSDAATGANVEVLVKGVINYAKAAVAVTVGQKMYYDAGADAVTSTSSSNKAIGWAASAAASGVATCDILLGGF